MWPKNTVSVFFGLSRGLEVDLAMADLDIPKSKVTCLLCRGFVGYKNSDRSRFAAHMKEEHEVRFDSDLVLAVSVLCRQDKETIVKAVLPRLEMVGKGELVLAANKMVPLLTASKPNGTLTPTLVKEERVVVKKESGFVKIDDDDKDKNAGKRIQAEGVAPPTSTRGQGWRAPSRGMPRRGGILPRGTSSPRGAASSSRSLPQRSTPSPQLVAPPRALHGNNAISVSVVDQSTPCTTCAMIFPTRDAMSEHMKATHLNKYVGLSIATPRETRDAPRSQEKARSPPRRQAPPARSAVVRDVREVMKEVNTAQEQNKKQRTPLISSRSNYGSASTGTQLARSETTMPRVLNNFSGSRSLPSPLTDVHIGQNSQGPATSKANHTQEEGERVKYVGVDEDKGEEEMDTENLLVEEKVRDEVKNMETLELMDNLINFLDDY